MVRHDKRRHVMRHGARDRDLAAVFQADGKAPRQIVIGHGGAASGDARRLGETARAMRLLGRFEREPAAGAAPIAEELDLLPAIRAEAVDVGHDRPATGAARRQREIERRAGAGADDLGKARHCFLSPGAAHRTSAAVPDLFDLRLRALRRDRAARAGPELFLFERVFDDCVERIGLADRQFDRALLIGCPDPRWPARLQSIASAIEVTDPGPLFASAAGGVEIMEDAWEPPPAAYDVVLAIGTLDTVNDLPLALRLIRHAMNANGLFIGAVAGGDTLPQLRSAMRSADAVAGLAAPHVHPRIEPSALSPLLDNAGFTRPVVDVDRVEVSYVSLSRLVADLRAMGATNVLTAKAPPLTRSQLAAAWRAFADAGDGRRTTEIIEFLHFAAWTPASE